MIRRGEQWGEPYDGRDVVWAASDRELAARSGTSGRPDRVCVALAGGDMFRTLGGVTVDRTTAGRDAVSSLPVGDLQMVPIDLLVLWLDDGPPLFAAAHIVVGRSRNGHPTWWGRTRIVANADFVGSANVAPGGHPNDGRVTVLDVNVVGRQRRLLRSRVAWGGHLPHPGIVSSSVSEGLLDLGEPSPILVDGVDVGRTTRLRFEVAPDAVDVVVIRPHLLDTTATGG